MNAFFIVALVLNGIVVGAGCWLGWQLLRQNGRILLRLDELEFGESSSSRREEALTGNPEIRSAESEIDESLVTSAATGDGDPARRFTNRSPARSRIKRDGLEAGTSAPSFRLPRITGGELSLEELRGKRVLLVFSDPHCGPCQVLAPHLEEFHREQAEISVVMISRGDPKENRAKLKENGLTFPVLLQQQWEVSRLFAMFATPMAYRIDENGVIAQKVAVGVDAIVALMAEAKGSDQPAAAAAFG